MWIFIAEARRWKIVGIMGKSYLHLIIEAAICVGGLISGIIAISLSRGPSLKRFVWSLALALAAIVIGWLGLFTPFSFWPRIAYSWTNGDYRIAMDLNCFFGAPLAFGTVGVWLAISRSWRLKRAA
jgi:hypothetical protein